MSKPDTATPLSSLRSIADQETLDRLCGEIVSLSSQISALEQTKEEKKKAAVGIAEAYKETKIRGGGWLLFRSEGRETLSKELLLQQGVSMEVIEAATVKGKPFYQVKKAAVTGNGEGQEG